MGGPRKSQQVTPLGIKPAVAQAETTIDLKWVKIIGWSLAGIYATAFVGLITWYLPKELNQARELVKGDTTALLNPLDQRLSRIEGWIESQRLVAASEQPTEEGLKQVRQIVEEARAKNVEMEPQAVSTAGNKLIAEAIPMPQVSEVAWDTIADLLSYRSLLNQANQPPGPPLVPWNRTQLQGSWRFSLPIRGRPGDEPTIGWGMGNRLIPAEEAAVIEPIGAANRNADQQLGPPHIILQAYEPDVSIQLDGHHFKKIVLRGFTIVYNGGPVVMEDVLFVNCTFRIDRNQTGVQLARRVLDSAFTSFQAS